MSTHAYITLIEGNVSKTIYVHSDGYVDYTGRMLLEHYNTIDQVKALIDLGNLSRLAPSTDLPPGHTFNRPRDGYCVAYGRDRDERNQQALVGNDDIRQEYDYHYVYENGEWTMFVGSYTRKPLSSFKLKDDLRSDYFVHPNKKPDPITEAIEQIKSDIKDEDYDALAELLAFVPERNLKNYLADY